MCVWVCRNGLSQGGILAMDDLIDIPVKENEYKIIRFANFLRGVFAQVTVDTPTLRLAARALGHLARAGGPMTADFVEFEVRRVFSGPTVMCELGWCSLQCTRWCQCHAWCGMHVVPCRVVSGGLMRACVPPCVAAASTCSGGCLHVPLVCAVLTHGHGHTPPLYACAQVKRALEWLQGGERYEARRHAAVLVLRQLADHAATLFYQHVPTFFSSIWMALCDPKYEIRESAAKALCSCLALVRHRQSRYSGFFFWWCRRSAAAVPCACMCRLCCTCLLVCLGTSWRACHMSLTSAPVSASVSASCHVTQVSPTVVQLHFQACEDRRWQGQHRRDNPRLPPHIW